MYKYIIVAVTSIIDVCIKLIDYILNSICVVKSYLVKLKSFIIEPKILNIKVIAICIDKNLYLQLLHKIRVKEVNRV